MNQLSKRRGSWIGALMQTNQKARLTLLFGIFALFFSMKAQAQTCYSIIATGGTNAPNAVGVPDGNVASISTGQSITIDFGVVVSANSVINLMSANPTGVTASSFSFSLDDITYSAPVNLAITPTLTLKQMSLPSNAKYMKISTGFILGSENIDAVYFNCPASLCFGVLTTGGTNPENSVGAPDGISTNTGPSGTIVLDMGVTLGPWTAISIMSKNPAYASGTTYAFSADNITYSAPAALSVTSTYTIKQFANGNNVRYLKIVGDATQGELVDAIYFDCPACATPVATVTSSQVTCAGGTANSDGKLVLSTFDASAKKVSYSLGSTYSGSGFATATDITGSSNFTVASTLPNPTINQPYTLRIYCNANTFIDKTVMLTPKQCESANLSVSVSPATKTGSLGEQLTYTVTLTNAGPSTATNVKVKVPMPTAATATLLSSSAVNGTYDALTNIWTVPSLAVGSTTMTFTVKVN